MIFVSSDFTYDIFYYKLVAFYINSKQNLIFTSNFRSAEIHRNVRFLIFLLFFSEYIREHLLPSSVLNSRFTSWSKRFSCHVSQKMGTAKIRHG